MTIVEIVDYFNGFSVFQNIINFKTKKAILWVFSGLAFILSAIIDNLTATIVLISILQKVVSDKNLRIWYAALIVIAANAGGAWSPIGDVTTTMLWIGKKVSTPMLIQYLLLPSIACAVVATGVASLLPAFKGEIKLNPVTDQGNKYSFRMLVLGLTSIVCVPVFKIITHLPPYVGMMLALGVVSIFAEIYSNREFELSKATGPDPDAGGSESKHHESPVHNALTKIELPSILFFLGILLAVAALESLGLLFVFATILKETISLDLLMVLFGFASAVIDNVPLVAASLGMFTEFAPDDQLWHFLAYCAGTGGSMLIIGSAAGVVAMGMEKITFGWYLKKILWIALVGYFAGIAVFLLMRNLI
jgi:Na+/H+ antiporter NhaD/arsenite permease-like protein